MNINRDGDTFVIDKDSASNIAELGVVSENPVNTISKLRALGKRANPNHTRVLHTLRNSLSFNKDERRQTEEFLFYIMPLSDFLDSVGEKHLVAEGSGDGTSAYLQLNLVIDEEPAGGNVLIAFEHSALRAIYKLEKMTETIEGEEIITSFKLHQNLDKFLLYVSSVIIYADEPAGIGSSDTDDLYYMRDEIEPLLEKMDIRVIWKSE